MASLKNNPKLGHDKPSLVGLPSTRNSKAVDVHVGNRIRLRRILLGLSQQQLAGALNLTFQQVQKYERSINRISASRLWDLSGILKCSISFFFEDMDELTAANGSRNWDGNSDDDMLHTPDLVNHHETLDLIRAYHRIDDTNIRQRIYQLTKSFVSEKAVAEKITKK